MTRPVSSRCSGSPTRHCTTRSATPPRATSSIHLDGRGPALKVEVVDDGTGFDPDDPELRSRHLGLTSMEERAHELGGTLELRSVPGEGTRVTLEVPRR